MTTHTPTQLAFGPDSQVLLIESEGHTDPDYSRRVVWGCVNSVPAKYQWKPTMAGSEVGHAIAR